MTSPLPEAALVSTKTWVTRTKDVPIAQEMPRDLGSLSGTGVKDWLLEQKTYPTPFCQFQGQDLVKESKIPIYFIVSQYHTWWLFFDSLLSVGANTCGCLLAHILPTSTLWHVWVERVHSLVGKEMVSSGSLLLAERKRLQHLVRTKNTLFIIETCTTFRFSFFLLNTLAWSS